MKVVFNHTSANYSENFTRIQSLDNISYSHTKLNYLSMNYTFFFFVTKV